MNALELRACLIALLFAVLVTVHVQLYTVFYVYSDVLGKSFNY